MNIAVPEFMPESLERYLRVCALPTEATPLPRHRVIVAGTPSRAYRLHRPWMLPVEQIAAYWTALDELDRIDQRLLTHRATYKDVFDLHTRMWRSIFYIKDSGDPQAPIIGEFTLENFTGEAAQIHFSVNPRRLLNASIQMARTITDYIVAKKDLGDDLPRFSVLFGLTPKSLRSVALFNRLAGFRQMAVLPRGILKYNSVEDALIFIKEGDHGR